MENRDYAWVSLFIDAELNTKEWITEKKGFEIVRPAQGIEMMNITGWRYSFLKKVGLMQAAYPYYGQIEAPMHELRMKLGMKYGYLKNYIEKPRPFDADPRYQAWKAAHVAKTFNGNFHEYLKQHKENL